MGWDFTCSLEMKPDPDKPWCKKCRDHTPNEEKQIACGYDNQGSTIYRTVYRCLKCDGIEMFIPTRRFSGGCVIGCFSILLLPCGLFTLWWGNWDPFIVFGPILFIGALCGLVGSNKTNSNYAIWEEWAKENGYNENDDTGISSEDE